MDQANLLDMIAVIDEERRYNEAAAVMAQRPTEREAFGHRARQATALVSLIRREMAGGQGSQSRQRINACIERLLDAEIEIGRTDTRTLDARVSRREGLAR
jgi:hypothetical protein